MRTIKMLAAALVALLIGATAMAALPATQPVYVMRHLDTPEGERDPDLTDQGKARAEALVGWFKDRGVTVIYVSDYKRTRQTAAPLAAAYGIPVKVYDPRDTPGLINMLKAEPGTALVIGHSNTVPDIIEQLGGTRPGPLAHADFGDIWVVAAGTTGHGKIP
ncbi:MAG: histidine phosphatase family protein [Sphingomonas sp.]